MYDRVGPHDWRESSVFDLATWKNGLAFKNINFADVGRPVIKIAELKNGVTSQTARTMEEYDPSVFVRPGDMLFSWSGNPDTSIDVFRWEGEEGWLNQHIFKVTPDKEISDDFLFFLLKFLNPRLAEIARNKQTTGLGHVTIQDLKRMQVAIPDSDEQAAITEIVGPIQEKIDLNRRMNETLEAMARTIFKDWFVDFSPTRAKAEGRAPYLAPELWDLFPDALDDEGKPVWWANRSLEDFLELAYGKSLPAKKRTPGQVAVYGSGGLTGTHDTALIDGPAVIVRRKGTVGSLYWEDGPVFPIDTVFYVVPRIGSVLFSYHLLAAQPLQDMNTDAAVPGLNRGNAYRLEFPQPTSELISAFEDVAGALWQRRARNLMEVETLTQTRDFLLPKLMSGEIRLREAEQAMEAMA